MSRTGNLFIDVFSFVVIFMPLVPVCIVFLQKKYTEDALNFLMILCLLYFIESILVSFPGLSWENRSIIGNIFSVIEMMIILQLLKTILPAKIKQSITFFIVAFLAALITYYSIKGISERRTAIDLIQNATIILVTIIALFELISNNTLYTLGYPVFWIATGSLFYFTIACLLNIMNKNDSSLAMEADPEKITLLNTANFIRFVLYAIAILVYQPREEEKNPPDN